MKRFITLNSENKVTSVRYGKKAVAGEIESEKGELGQIYDETTDTFITPTPEPTTPEPTLEDKINFLYYREKGLI